MGSYDVVYMSNVLNSKSRVRKDSIEEQRTNVRVNSEGCEEVEENQLPSLRTVEEKRIVRFCNKRLIEQK